MLPTLLSVFVAGAQALDRRTAGTARDAPEAGLRSRVPVTAEGRYRIGPVRAGQYFLLAFPPGAPTPYRPDREQLSTFEEAAERITSSANEERTFDLQVRKQEES